MGKSKIFIGLTLCEVLLLLGILLVSRADQAHWYGNIGAQQELIRHLTLTDFAIWTEARYTRHPSQADFFSPFQDFPSSIEHFPAGSVIAPVYAPESESR